MATPNPTVNLSGLARRLVMDGLIDENEATKAHEMALKKRTHFVSYLVDNKILSSQDIAWSGAQEFGVPLFDIEAMDMEVAPIRLVSEKLIKQHNALPLFRHANRLYVAVSDLMPALNRRIGARESVVQLTLIGVGLAFNIAIHTH